jgi:hypothetical protein
MAWTAQKSMPSTILAMGMCLLRHCFAYIHIDRLMGETYEIGTMTYITKFHKVWFMHSKGQDSHFRNVGQKWDEF